LRAAEEIAGSHSNRDRVLSECVAKAGNGIGDSQMDETGKISSVTVEADNGAKPETGIQPKPKRRNSRRNRWLLWIGAVVVLLFAAGQRD